ncbi:MAG: O-antigen ligase family protein [Candidatus Aphodosoma sp.]
MAIVWFMTQDQKAIVSNVITASFLYVAFAIFVRRHKLNKQWLIIATACSIIAFLNVTLSMFGSVDDYKKAIMFSVSMFWLVYVACNHINKRTVDVLLLINALVSIVYIYTYNTGGFALYEDVVLLTLNFPNPNQTGMFLLSSAMMLTLPVFSEKEMGYNVIIRVVSIVLVVVLLSLLFLTGCRSAYGAYAAFLILTLLEFIPRFKFRLKKWQIWLWSLSPLLFAILYVQLIGSIDFDTSFGMESSGKDNTTRLSVWNSSFNTFWDWALLGAYSSVESIVKFSHVHNTHLDVWMSYGVVPFILFLFLLYKVTWVSYEQANTRFQQMSLYAFMACFIQGFFEASLMSGSAGLFLLSFGFLLISNANFNVYK